MVAIEYEEIDGLLYPCINIGIEGLHKLGKFGKAKLEYIHNKNMDLYQALLVRGDLLQYLIDVDKSGYEKSEILQQEYLAKYDLPSLDFMEVVQLRFNARNWADEVIMRDILNEIGDR